MYKAFKMVKSMVKTCPLPLLAIKDEKLIQLAESMLPYSVGMEFEIHTSNISLKDVMFHIPNLISFDKEEYEVKFRIPSGIKGLICLWEISVYLTKHCQLNTMSGVHYHIDFTDVCSGFHGNQLFRYEFTRGAYDTNSVIRQNDEWIMNALKNWDYKGVFNARICSLHKTAVRFHSDYKTMEVRIGEMTFDYELLVKRIINCQNIAKRLKKILSEDDLKKSKAVEGPKVVGRIQL